MALTFLMNEETYYMKPWDQSPRLPASVQKKFASLSGDAKLQAQIKYYILNEELVNLVRSISEVGFSPLDFVHGIVQAGSIIVFDGARRLIATLILRDPELINRIDGCGDNSAEGQVLLELYSQVLQIHFETHKNLISGLASIPVMKYNPGVYSLAEASTDCFSKIEAGMKPQDFAEQAKS